MGVQNAMNDKDVAWVADLGAGRSEAVTRLRTALLRNLRRALAEDRRVDEAFLEDAVQESLIRILDRMAEFEGRSRFQTWATTIALRVAMSELRKRRWKDVSLDDILADTASPLADNVDEDLPPDEQAARRALLETLQDAIEHGLTDLQRKALVAELRGMPQDQIAAQLGKNRNAIYKLTHDARKRLKRTIEMAGYGVDDLTGAGTT